MRSVQRMKPSDHRRLIDDQIRSRCAAPAAPIPDLISHVTISIQDESGNYERAFKFLSKTIGERPISGLSVG